MALVADVSPAGRAGTFKPTAFTAALAVTLLLAVVEWAGGYAGLTMDSDTDSMLRLVQVRDLLAGQGWFDLTQYRMGPPGGFEMHWSRLVDAPIALLIALFTFVSGSAATGETLALIAWPTLLFFLAAWFTARMAVQLGGDNAVLPAAALLFPNLALTPYFNAGSIDHHNVQFVLTLAAATLLVEAKDRPRLAILSGVLSGVSIGVGMEAALYVAVVGLACALWFALKGEEAASAAAGYGLGLAGAGVAIMLATVPPQKWLIPACDAFSLPQMSAALAGGLGLALAATLTRSSGTGGRILALGAAGALVALLLVLFFPQCLAAPYSNLDPRQQAWIGQITETKPIWAVFRDNPALGAATFAPAILGLFVCVQAIRRNERPLQFALTGGMLLAAILIAAYQIRGSVFAFGFASAPLAAWIAHCWTKARTDAPGAKLKLTLACLLSVNMSWIMAANSLAPAKEKSETAAGAPAGRCDNAAAVAPLARLAPTRVLNDFNTGPAILLFSGQHVLTGTYHRNLANMLGYDIQAADAAEARRLIMENGIGAVSVCMDGDEEAALTRTKPDSLHALLRRAEAPAWLELVPETKDSVLKVYRIVSPAPQG